MSAPLVIDWNWQYLPSNNDEVVPLTVEKVDGKEVFIYHNKTHGQILVEYEGYYGVLIKGDSNEPVSGSSS